MAETSGIAWTRSTFNPWIGCTKIGPGCDHCYAAESRPVKAFGIQWGAGQPRHRTSIQNWGLPLKWNRLAAQERETGKVSAQSKGWDKPGFWPVFCASLADVFDNEVPPEWLAELFHLIRETPNLEWLLVTKRISNAARTAKWLEQLPNVRLMITVCDQEEADRDIPKLLALPVKNGISYEPALGPVSFVNYFEQYPDHNGVRIVQRHQGLDWIIIGGESNQGAHKARPFQIDWAYKTLLQCNAARVPCFVKQLGSAPYFAGPLKPFRDRAGANPAEWPADLQIREFP